MCVFQRKGRECSKSYAYGANNCELNLGALPEECDNCWETILKNPSNLFEVDKNSVPILVNIHK